ncbi:MAG: HEAT repeat domain-containing protein [Sedimentisphaerales bacterium]|nr:HEAT repeat domain-containing protein [Sedimentisphaerales bacterium]
MLNGRIVAVLLFLVGCSTAGAASAQQRTLADNWNDYLHYAKIGNLDLAKGYAQAILQSDPDPVALLELVQANPTGYELAMRVVNTASDTDLVALTKKLLGVIDLGRFMRRSDPQVIVEEVRRLSGTVRARMNATTRLKNAGEYAIPFMLDALADPARRAEMDVIIETLPQIGRPAIRPLVAALQTQNSTVKAEIIRALGKIGYPQSLAYLRYVVENDPSAELRDLATQSIRLIDPRAVNTPAASLFFNLGERYYHHDESLAPQEGAPIANVWFWDEGTSRLERVEVAPVYFYELMSMRCCEWSLKADAQFGLSIGLWLAAFFKAESTGLPMPEYFGPNHAGALVYATTAGPEYLHQALARAISDRNAAVALGAVEALATNAGERSLLYAVGPVQPVLQALVFPDRAVRYSAAIAIANAGPRQGFNESGLVVRNLAEALAQGGTAAESSADWTPELADRYALRAAQAMLKVAVSRNPVIDLLQAQSALIAATHDNREQIQVLAGQILAYLNSPNAQRAIAEAALDGSASMDVRIAAFGSLANSAKMNGNLLPDATVARIYALTSSDQTEPDLRAAAAAAYGALNLPSQMVKTLILDQAKS